MHMGKARVSFNDWHSCDDPSVVATSLPVSGMDFQDWILYHQVRSVVCLLVGAVQQAIDASQHGRKAALQEFVRLMLPTYDRYRCITVDCGCACVAS